MRLQSLHFRLHSYRQLFLQLAPLVLPLLFADFAVGINQVHNPLSPEDVSISGREKIVLHFGQSAVVSVTKLRCFLEL